MEELAVYETADGGRVIVTPDLYPVNPREEFDNLGTMICFHRRYALGDEHGYGDVETWLSYLLCDCYSENTLGDTTRPYKPLTKGVESAIAAFKKEHKVDRYSWADFLQDVEEGVNKEIIDEALARLEPFYLFLPLYLYDHSGLTMNTTGFTCPWDSGQVGWIYVSLDKVREEWGTPLTKKRREKALSCLRAEVEEYDQYLRGDVYGIIHFDKEETVVDSCFGFFDYEYACSEAEELAKHA